MRVVVGIGNSNKEELERKIGTKGKKGSDYY